MTEKFTVDIQQNDTIWVFTTHGYINNLAGEIIAEKFEEALKSRGKKFLFDMADTKLINSIGVSILIEILEKTLESEGTMAFCNCAPIIEKTFKIMGIIQYANIYGTMEDALKELA